MAVEKRGKYYYGDNQSDLRAEIARLSEQNAYPAEHFADAVCRCGGKLFRVNLDDVVGAAVRICVACSDEHPIGDSDEYLNEATLDECACACGGEQFEVTVGVSLYDDSEDVNWLYVGCRCPSCGLVGVYGDWSNEFEDYRALLARV
jgi:hypothetical protein